MKYKKHIHHKQLNIYFDNKIDISV